MRNFYRTTIVGLFALCFAASGCQTTVTTNTNATTANAGNTAATNGNSASVNANTGAPSVVIETREPETYQATVTLTAETMGDQQKPNIPPLAAQVARKGEDKRMEFGLPNNEKVIYLDRAGKHFLVFPNRKQYAELNQEALGFQVRDLMTPGQMVKQLQNVKGVERVGEETVDGRTVVRYRLKTTANTQTQAGKVDSESNFLIDKETGLPLRTETFSQSQGGQVQGVNALRIVTTMNNIQTTAPDELFAEPTGFQKVEAEQVRQQVNAVFSVVMALMGQMMQNPGANTQTAPTPGATPAVSPAMSPLVSPTP